MACKAERLWRPFFLTLSLGWAALLFAQDAEQVPAGVETEAGAESLEEALPSIEFLEFLGQWETEDGEWIAPEELANEEFAQLLEAAFETGIEDSD